MVSAPLRIAVVIPCFRVRKHILDVLAGIGPAVERIYVVDDTCPENTADLVAEKVSDPRVRVVRHEVNQGVGGAVVSGYRAAIEEDMDIVVKVDGDGQMDPKLIAPLIHLIEIGEADYVKGNRFHRISALKGMPALRLFGNAALSFLTKLSSGYWQIFDPTNGFTAIHRAALEAIELDGLSKRYFFESDMLIQLGHARAVVADMPMRAHYGDEDSNLKISRVITEFFWRHVNAIGQRLMYQYLLRDFTIASANLLVGLVFVLFGITYGAINWRQSVVTGIVAPTGVIILATLTIILGVQMLLFFLSYDISATPRVPLQRWYRRRKADP
ncbi:MAG: glycosyltransferase family 2 protein [Myxococcota bacterium]